METILLSTKIKEQPYFVGSKALRLSELKRDGLPVPDLAVIPSIILKDLYHENDRINTTLIEHIVDDIRQRFWYEKYAVRSAALLEDGRRESMAGQFKTEINVTIDTMREAIEKVVRHAHTHLKGDLGRFSIIIQQYIEPDFAGITFTRNPVGGREMLIEYHAGRGEKVVGGQVRPKSLSIFWPATVGKSELPGLSSAIDIFQTIEKKYAFPQDIEWCVKEGKWYVLQSRPITSLSSDQYEEALFLDQSLPRDRDFFYEKNEVSEIAPRPATVTFELLRRIYGVDGPVHRVYGRYKVRYQPVDFLRLVGNELYCDREAELETLLPACSLLNDNFSPKISRWSGIWTTFRNIGLMGRLPLKDPGEMLSSIKSALDEDLSAEKTIGALVKKFMSVYELIFEINMLASAVNNRLKQFAARHNLTAEQALSGADRGVLKNLVLDYSERSWAGNCLDVADQAPFVASISKDNKPAAEIVLPSVVAEASKTALIFLRLREYGRWITVRYINELRNRLHDMAMQSGIDEVSLSYFARLDELEQNELAAEVLKQRKTEYEKYNIYEFPVRLHNRNNAGHKADLQGVSPGNAQGVAAGEEQLPASADSGQPIILVTKTLSPHLARYFDRIGGIVSQQGGMLSHLAILAREKNIPVIVGFQPESRLFMPGDKISIDGTSGEIKKI